MEAVTDPETGSDPARSAGSTATGAAARPPTLPPVTTGVWHIAVPGTVIWFVAFAVLLFFIPELRAADAMIWLWTCLAGFVTGLLGLSVYGWQRRAARLGKRSANQMALTERF